MNTNIEKIAYVCSDPGVPVFGEKGCSIHVQEVIRTFRKLGVEVTLFAQRLGGPPPADLADVAVYRLSKLSKESVSSREQDAIAGNLALHALLDAHGPFDMVYERYSLWGYAGMAHARDQHIPGILEVNAPLIEEQRRHRMLVHEEDAQNILNCVTGDASALIAVSDQVGAYLQSLASAAGKIHVIPNGVDPDRFSPLRKASGETAFTFGFVGTLKPWHGMLDVVEAFYQVHQKAPDSRLLVVGDGPERTMLEARLAAYGLTLAAQFTGSVSSTDVPGWIASMDVGLAPYPPLENCYFSPLKVFEYMASGIAVVGSDIGQVGKLVLDGENGLLYPPGDTKKLADVLLYLYENPELCMKMGRAAREGVFASYTWQAVGKRILSIAENCKLSEVV